jgi:uncharacterized damage-inducible protein DinB
VQDAIRHQSWATALLLEACSALSGEQLRQPVPAIYGSVLDTLRHLVDSDGWYAFRLAGGTDGRVGLDETADLAAIRAMAEENAGEWEGLLANGLDPAREIVTVTTEGTIVDTFVGIRLAQAWHHGSDHRSQVCTVLTTFGVEPPAIDVWDYGEAVGRLSEEPVNAES